jgi:hypothetical protein
MLGSQRNSKSCLSYEHDSYLDTVNVPKRVTQRNTSSLRPTWQSRPYGRIRPTGYDKIYQEGSYSQTLCLPLPSTVFQDKPHFEFRIVLSLSRTHRMNDARKTLIRLTKTVSSANAMSKWAVALSRNQCANAPQSRVGRSLYLSPKRDLRSSDKVLRFCAATRQCRRQPDAKTNNAQF